MMGPDEAGAGGLGEEGGKETGEEGGCIVPEACHLMSTRCLYDTVNKSDIRASV